MGQLGIISTYATLLDSYDRQRSANSTNRFPSFASFVTMSSTPSGFPTLQPAVVTKINVGEVHDLGESAARISSDDVR